MTEIQTTPKRDFISNIFISSDEPRLRAGWRILLQVMLMFITLNCLSIPVVGYFILNGSLKSTSVLNGIPPGLLLPLQGLELAAFAISVYLARRFFDKRTFVSLGFKLNLQAVYDTLAGIFISALIMTFIFAIEYAAGWVKVEAFSWEVDSLSTILISTLMFAVIFILVGLNEELLFRGYYLQNLMEGTGAFSGIIISSFIFGLVHITNPNATWYSVIGIFFAGLFFSYAYLQTTQLWLPIGLHIGWNFCEAVVFGFPVSGLDIYRLMRHQVHGPEIWTGGAFGPEAGLIVLPALMIGSIFIHLYTRHRN